MGSFDTYRTRMSFEGNSVVDSYNNETSDYINSNFSSSPTFIQIEVNGVTFDSRVIRTENPHQKRIMFRPSTIIYEGDYITYKGDSWLIQHFEPHPLFPVATALQCNDSLRWKDSNDVLHTVPCVLVSLHRMVTLMQDTQQETIKYQLRGFAPRTSETDSLQISQRFIFGSQAFICVGLDSASGVYDGHGCIEIATESTDFITSDDKVNKVADNSRLWIQNTGLQNGGGTATW